MEQFLVTNNSTEPVEYTAVERLSEGVSER